MRVELDQAGILALYRDQDLADAIVEEARLCAVQARLDAPVRFGDYRRSIFVRRTRAWAIAIYGSGDFKAWMLEYGTQGPGRRRTPAFHTLRNAAVKQGLKLKYLVVK